MLDNSIYFSGRYVYNSSELNNAIYLYLKHILYKIKINFDENFWIILHAKLKTFVM